MTVMCAWCGKILRVTADNALLISHGICNKCLADVRSAAKEGRR